MKKLEYKKIYHYLTTIFPQTKKIKTNPGLISNSKPIDGVQGETVNVVSCDGLGRFEVKGGRVAFPVGLHAYRYLVRFLRNLIVISLHQGWATHQLAKLIRLS